MNTIQLSAVLPALIEARQATFLWGPPGVGKSAIVHQVAAATGLDVRDLRLSICDPTDLRGIPFFDPATSIARWAPPEFLPREGRGVLFLDELNAAPPSVQAAAYQLVLDRRLGEYELPEGWAVIGAGNRRSDIAVVHRMPSPLANRFCHLELEPDLEAWRLWAHRSELLAGVIGFLGHRPELLFRLDRESASGAFPTPRSWEAAARLLGRSSLPRAAQQEVIGGCVGDGPALELLAYLDVADRLPSAESILAGEVDEVPRELSVLYALVGALLQALRREPTERRIERGLSYVSRMPAELSVLAIKDGLRLGLDWSSSAKWEAWMDRFGDVVL